MRIPIFRKNFKPMPNGNSSMEDSWGFYKRWCTSWVAFKVNQMWKTDKGFFNGMYGTSETSKLGNARPRIII